MQRIVVVGILCVCLTSISTATSEWCDPFPSMGVDVGTTPLCPTPEDSVTVGITVWFPNLCWSPARLDSSTMQGAFLEVYLSTEHSGSLLCFQQAFLSSFDVPFGVLPEGSYQVEVTVSIDTGTNAGTYLCTSGFSVNVSGDTNADGVITSADVILLVNHIFRGGTLPCNDTGDANCDGLVTSADAIYLVNYVFKGGPAPACP